MSEEDQRVGGFVALFLMATVPLLAMVHLPADAWTRAALLGLASWTGVGIAIMAARARPIEPRGHVDAVWASLTMTPAATLLVMDGLGLAGLGSRAPGLAVAAAGTILLLTTFWMVYARPTGAGDAVGRHA